MTMKKFLAPTLAIITLLALACVSGGDTQSGANAPPQDPTATPDPASQALAAVAELDLGDFDANDMQALLQELMNSPGLTDCLTNSLSLSNLMELAEREPTDADVEQILPCFSQDQLDSISSAILPALELGDLDIAEMEGLLAELAISPELTDCLAGSLNLPDLMELLEREPTDSDIEGLLPCFSGDQLDALTSVTVPESDIGSLKDFDFAELAELMNSPETMNCLTSSMSLSSLMELAGSEPTDADLELIFSCFSEEQLNSLGGLTGAQ